MLTELRLRFVKATVVPTRDTRALRSLVSMDLKPLYLKQFSRFPNFGDEIGTFLLRKLWPGELRLLGPRAEGRPNMLLIGSILHWADPWSIVCGAGAIHPQAAPLAAKKILLTRGPLTNGVLSEAGMALPEMVGDPGCLLPLFIDSPEPLTDEIGIVPHYADVSGALRRAVSSEGIKFIDVMKPVEQVVSDIKSCGIILSSSLHGLVVGDAYRKPTTWLRLGDRLHGGNFKFRDYLLSQGLPDKYCEPVVRFSTLRETARNSFIKPTKLNAILILAAIKEAIREAT